MGQQPSSEKQLGEELYNPHSSHEEAQGHGGAGQSKTSSQPIPNDNMTGVVPGDQSPQVDGSGRSHSSSTPSSLTERVRAMVIPRIPDDHNIKQSAQTRPHVETVPTAFKWSYGGSRVFVTGSFNNWQGKIMMHANDDNPNEFVLVIAIPLGRHHYKFIVDEQWRVNPDSPQVTDAEGREVNEVLVEKPLFELTADDDSDNEVDEGGQKITYDQVIPGPEEYTANPPKAPPHLSQRNVVLNNETVDPYILKIPGHELINHLLVYGNGTEKSDALVTSITQRFRTKASISVTPKFVTLVYYRPKPESSSHSHHSSSSGKVKT